MCDRLGLDGGPMVSAVLPSAAPGCEASQTGAPCASATVVCLVVGSLVSFLLTP